MVACQLALVGGTKASSMPHAVPDVSASSFAYIIADDHPSVTLAVGQMLAELVGVAPSHFVTVNTSTTLLTVCAEQTARPRIVVLDLVMPGDLKRVALVRALLAVDMSLRVLVYSADESAFLAGAVLGAGATGYVAKTSPSAELIDALIAVAKGHIYLDSRINLDSVKQHPWASLTDSERTVLISSCRGAKAHEIVEASGRTYSTVTTHKYNALNKLGLRDSNDLLAYIYEHGLLYELDEAPPFQKK